jgi:hypothetical protein
MGKILKAFLKNKGNIVMSIFIILLGIGMVIGTPFLFIFALRLLGLETPYNFYSWLGSFIILAILSSAGSGKKEE